MLATGRHYLPTDYARVIALRVDREGRYFLPSILAIGDRLNEFSGAAVILQDVTRFRLLDDAKTNLVGTVSHELKTPLTSLRLAVYLLLEKKVGPLTAGPARASRDRPGRGRPAPADHQGPARPGPARAGSAALSLRRIAAADLVADAARDGRLAARARPAAGRQGRPLPRSGLGRRRPPEARLHQFPDQRRQIRAAGRQGRALRRARPARLGPLRCGVRDEGPGVPEEAVARIFDRFYRVPGSPKTGAGLGLAIAREIVFAHGGSMAAPAARARGATFISSCRGTPIRRRLRWRVKTHNRHPS